MRSSRPETAVLLAAAALSLLLAAAPGGAQERDPLPHPCGDSWIDVPALTGAYVDFARVAELLGHAPLRPPFLRRSASDRVLPLCGTGILWDRRTEREPPPSPRPTVHLLPLSTVHEFNSAYPSDRNNGARWAGRGLSSTLTGGVHARWGPLSVQLAPGVHHQRNRAFETQPARFAARDGLSEFVYPGHPGRIDLPQRFGDGPFSTVDAGQSYLRVDGYGMAAGISTENLWWGPAIEQPILLGSSAAGFPHLFLGTSEPIDIGIGRLSAATFWGRLDESGYFDSEPDNDHRLFAGLGFAIEPWGLDGLTLGAGRTFMVPLPPGGLSAWDFFYEPYHSLVENRDDDNELLGVFARWAFQRSGFEIYTEGVREDHWADINDLLAEPDHSLGYVAGMQKVTPLTTSRWLRLHAELFRLEIGSASHRSNRGITTFYIHNRSPQGYTHRGQMLGAPAGPGSSGGHLAADLFTDRGRIGAFVRRTFYDNDAYYSNKLIQGLTRGDNRDWELTVGLRQLAFLGDFDLSWSASWSHRNNRSLIGLSREGDGNFPEHNWAFELGASWRAGGEPW